MLKAKVGYSKNVDAYEAGVETAKTSTEGMNAKIALLFNSVGYDQKKTNGRNQICSNRC